MSIGESFSLDSDTGFRLPKASGLRGSKKSIHVRNVLTSQSKYHTSGTNLSLQSNGSEDGILKQPKRRAPRKGKSSLAGQ